MLNYCRARFWMLLAICPQCFYEAPDIYDCPVCGDYSTMFDGYPVPKHIRRLWWRRWLMLNRRQPNDR